MNAPFPQPLESRSLAPVAPVAAETPAIYGGSPAFGSGLDGVDSNARAMLLRYIGLILKHKLLILCIVVGAIVAGFVVTYLMTPLYSATTIIQIDRDAPKTVSVSRSGPDEGSDPTFLQTQIELLKSRSLAERVASNLDLAQASGFLERADATNKLLGNPAEPPDAALLEARRKAAVARVAGGLTIQPVPYSRLVRVAYTGPDPIWAQKISVAVADNFIGSTLDRRFGATTYTRNFLEERLQQLKIKIEESEKQVVAYAQREGIVNADDKTPQASVTLAAINQALVSATADRLKSEQLWNQAQGSNGLGLPQIMSDGAVQAARQKRAQLSADYQDKLTLLKPAFPEMIQLKSQISELDRQIKTQVELVKESIRNQYEAAKAQEASFSRKAEEVKAQVLDQRGRSVEYQILQREADTNRSLYDGLLQQYKEAGVSIAAAASNVSIVDKAEVPVGPIRPILLVNILIALGMGLLCASATIFILETLDDTFKMPEQVEESLGLTVLGVTPKSLDLKVTEALADQRSPLAEAYRSLRTALQFSTASGAPKSLLITSSRPGEGKSTTSVSLAANFAQLGQRVLLIDADLRNPSLHRVLEKDNSKGLSNYLSGNDDPALFTQDCAFDGVTFMATGPLPPNPAELLAGPLMVSLLSAATETFDIVIIDGPPIMGLADAPILSSVIEATILVIEAGATRRGVVRAALKRLRFARAKVGGALLNKFDPKQAGHTYGYGYGYGYGSEYSYGVKEQTSALPSV